MPQAIHIDGGAKLVGGKYDGARLGSLPYEEHQSGHAVCILDMGPPAVFGDRPVATGSLRRHLYERQDDGSFAFKDTP
jgi:hypothetical protein